MVTRLQALREGIGYLMKSGVPAAELEARVLLGHVLGQDCSRMMLELDKEISCGQLEQFRSLYVLRGDKRYPLQYITGRVEFMSLPLIVRRGVVIPRQETEVLAEIAIQKLRDRLSNGRVLKVADVGTGSGAIAVTLAYYLRNCMVYATDISPLALEVARENAQLLGVGDRIMLLSGHLLDCLRGFELERSLDAIVSNLPYISSSDYDSKVPLEVKWEPLHGFLGGHDGLALYRELIPQARDFLMADGFLALEVGAGQALTVANLCRQLGGFNQVEIFKDLAGIDRVVVAKGRGDA